MNRPIDATKGIRPSKAAEMREPADPCDSERIDAMLNRTGWFILRVTPGAEFLVIDRLARADRFAFTPVDRVWRKWTKFCTEKSLRQFAIVPGYVVVAMPQQGGRWFKVFDTEGVHEVMGVTLRNGSTRPVDIGPANADRIRDMCRGAEAVQRRMRKGEEYKVGDRARVVVGPLDGQEFIVDRFEDSFEDGMRVAEARAIIVATILGSAREVSIPVGDMVKVEAD